MAEKHFKIEGAPSAWNSMAGFLPVFSVAMAVLLLATLLAKGIIG